MIPALVASIGVFGLVGGLEIGGTIRAGRRSLVGLRQPGFIERGCNERMEERTPGIGRRDRIAKQRLVNRVFMLAADQHSAGLGVPLKCGRHACTVASVELAEHGGLGLCAGDSG